jgi:hypothetical protein
VEVALVGFGIGAADGSSFSMFVGAKGYALYKGISEEASGSCRSRETGRASCSRIGDSKAAETYREGNEGAELGSFFDCGF